MQDEWFHVPQTQRYCRGDYEHWDPKITTFPGLYLLGKFHASAMSPLQSFLSPRGKAQEPCSTGVLRSLNVLLVPGFFIVVQQLYKRLHPHHGSESATLMVGHFQCIPADELHLPSSSCISLQLG